VQRTDPERHLSHAGDDVVRTFWGARSGTASAVSSASRAVDQARPSGRGHRCSVCAFCVPLLSAPRGGGFADTPAGFHDIAVLVVSRPTVDLSLSSRCRDAPVRLAERCRNHGMVGLLTNGTSDLHTELAEIALTGLPCRVFNSAKLVHASQIEISIDTS
jgi:hypothetical protein